MLVEGVLQNAAVLAVLSATQASPSTPSVQPSVTAEGISVFLAQVEQIMSAGNDLSATTALETAQAAAKAMIAEPSRYFERARQCFEGYGHTYRALVEDLHQLEVAAPAMFFKMVSLRREGKERLSVELYNAFLDLYKYALGEAIDLMALHEKFLLALEPDNEDRRKLLIRLETGIELNPGEVEGIFARLHPVTINTLVTLKMISKFLGYKRHIAGALK